jgi:tetratricopeptide (TPR) repeat protein
VLPAELQSAVLGRAEGNPLYTEEYVRMLQDRGFLLREGSSWRLVTMEELPLPETVHGTIAARLDALDEDVKLLIQDASVIGKVFWVGALTALGDRDRSAVERSLHELERRELVRSARRASVAGESEYAFRHALVRDVAYGQMPRPRRAEKHGLAAAWIEALERPEDHADMVTHHYLAALEYAEAAGLDAVDLRLRARGALTASGDRAFALNAFVPAIGFYSDALSRTASEAGERAQLLFRLGRARYHGEAAGEDELVEAADAFLLRGDVETAAEALQLLGELVHQRGQSEGGRAQLRRAAELVGERPASRSKARVLGVFARYLALGGELREAEEVARQALAVTAEAATPQLEIHAHLTLATVMSFAGDPGGMAEFERALALGQRVPTADVVRAYGNYGSVMEDVAGDIARARELREEGCDWPGGLECDSTWTGCGPRLPWTSTMRGNGTQPSPSLRRCLLSLSTSLISCIQRYCWRALTSFAPGVT